jgi:hypothetical protein
LPLPRWDATAENLDGVFCKSVPERGEIAIHPGPGEVLAAEEPEPRLTLDEPGQRLVLANLSAHRPMPADRLVDVAAKQQELPVCGDIGQFGIIDPV